MGYLKNILIGVLCLAVGAGVGRYLTPPKIQEKIVEKEVTKTQEHTVTVVVKNPNGGETTTITHDVNTTITDNKKTDIQVTNRPDWRAYAGTGYNIDAGKQTYIIGVDRRIISEVTIGVYGTTNHEVGVTLGIGF